jgi:fatty acid hydroxylase domain-containing protein 2
VYFMVYPLWRREGGAMLGPGSIVEVAWQLVVFVFCEDTVFYWAHRLLHTRFLFRYVHARHHRFRHVRSLAAEFAHPLESAINFVAFFLGPVLLGSSFGVVCIWIVVRMFETVEAHSGYAFTGSSSRHSFHHLHAQRGCYGSFVSVWEIVMGTDKQWRAWRASGAKR